jgi:LEA14-like dessication related protein
MLPRLRYRVLLACVLAGASSCSLRPHYERPEVSVVGVQLRGGNLLHQNIAVTLHVENPNDRDLPVREVHADLSVEGQAVATGVSDAPFRVPAHGAADVAVTVTANLLRVAAQVANKMNDGTGLIGYEVVGAAEVDLTWVHSLPFRQSGSFSLNPP